MKDTRRAFILAAGLTAVTMRLHCETPQAGTSQFKMSHLGWVG
jgi:hypothetical protein